MNNKYHMPVLLKDCIDGLNIRPDGIYLDGTLGGGGHFKAVAEKLGKNGIAIGIDRDPDSISWVLQQTKNSLAKIIIEQSEFSGFQKVLDNNGIGFIDGILLDLGVSSRQIDAASRGFSYLQDGPLDMRMNPLKGKPASELLKSLSLEELTEMFGKFGEVENPGRLARCIKEKIKTSEIKTSGEFKACLEAEYGTYGIKLLAKSFQALRISVNKELEELENCLAGAVSRLAKHGRLVVISYHSLEDRIVKNFFRDNEKRCVCPPNLPVCICKKAAMLKRITRKAVIPSAEEINLNRRSRSAKLRVAEMTGCLQTES